MHHSTNTDVGGYKSGNEESVPGKWKENEKEQEILLCIAMKSFANNKRIYVTWDSGDNIHLIRLGTEINILLFDFNRIFSYLKYHIFNRSINANVLKNFKIKNDDYHNLIN